MFSTRRGFSLVEMVIALVTGSILVSIAAPTVSGARDRFAVSGARSTFSSLHARARAQAIERGSMVSLVIDATGDSVSIWAGSERLETVRFATEFRVDIRASDNVTRLCMTPRGYADPDCNSFGSEAKITFWQNADHTTVTLLPMGQLVS